MIIKGADIYIFSDLPFGAGFSSSASLNTTLLMLIIEIYQLNISKLDLAKITQKVEHQYIGQNVGLWIKWLVYFHSKMLQQLLK